MRRFLYFIPGQTGAMISAEDQGKAKLSHLGRELETRGSKGPDGAGGMLVGVSTPGPTISYAPDAQTWHKVAGVWVGYQNGEMPGPEDLARPDALPGGAVVLEDGNHWTVPIARSTVNDTTIPQTLGLDADGTMVTGPIARYKAIVDDAERVWNHYCHQWGFEDAERVDITVAEAWEIAGRALAQNYRLSGVEASVLGIFTTSNIKDVIEQLIDLPSLEAMQTAIEATQKKTELPATPDTSDTADG